MQIYLTHHVEGEDTLYLPLLMQDPGAMYPL